MCATKAQFAWDIVIKKFGDFIFIDKRDTENILDWQTISETAQPDYQSTDDESISGTRQLMKEATSLNKSFQYSVNKKTNSKKLQHPDPHIEEESQIIARCGYTYKLWQIKNKGTLRRICVRSAIHSYNETTLDRMNLFAFHEWNQKH